MLRHRQSSIAANMSGIAFDEDKGREVLGVKPKLTQHLSPSRYLCRGESNCVVTLMGKDESD